MINRKFIRQVGFSKWIFRYSLLQFRKRVLRRDGCMKLPTGSKFIVPRHSPNASEVFVTNANMDWGSEALFARFSQPKRDFLDIGAHVGYYSAYLSPLVRCCYAFEPDPRNLAALRANAALAGNIKIIEQA